jgi:hypothetical protein
MKFDFTDGEWGGVCLNDINGCDCGYIFNLGGATIVKVKVNDPLSKNYERLQDTITLKQAKANQTLIACAPEMIKALIYMVKETNALFDVGWSGCDRIIQLIEKALDKKWSEINE